MENFMQKYYCYDYELLCNKHSHTNIPSFCFQMYNEPYCMQINLPALYFILEILWKSMIGGTGRRTSRNSFESRALGISRYCFIFFSNMWIATESKQWECRSKWKNHFSSRDNKLKALSSYIAQWKVLRCAAPKSLYLCPWSGFCVAHVIRERSSNT